MYWAFSLYDWAKFLYVLLAYLYNFLQDFFCKSEQNKRLSCLHRADKTISWLRQMLVRQAHTQKREVGRVGEIRAGPVWSGVSGKGSLPEI